MKIAVAAMGKTVAGHFGHCENFIFFETKEETIVSESSVPNPGHRPGFLPNFLADNGAEVIIAGGMGGGAADIFNERGVDMNFDALAAESYGKIRADLQKAGTPVGPLDMMIAGHAKSRRFIVVTNNTKDFERVKGLKIENWVD